MGMGEGEDLVPSLSVREERPREQKPQVVRRELRARHLVHDADRFVGEPHDVASPGRLGEDVGEGPTALGTDVAQHRGVEYDELSVVRRLGQDRRESGLKRDTLMPVRFVPLVTGALPVLGQG